jgi:RNA polymerase sigma-70 factor (ECF subfamily)
MDFKGLTSNSNVFRAFQKGDEKAFTCIYEALKYSVYTTTRRIVGSSEDAEDITVEAFALAWERRQVIKSMDHLKNLLHVIARNTSITLLRNKGSVSHYDIDEILDQLDSDNTVRCNNDRIFADLVEELHKAMERMPKVRKTVFQMRYFEERPADEVAASLNISVHTVYWHTKLALVQLRELLSNKRASITELGIVALIFLHKGI